MRKVNNKKKRIVVITRAEKPVIYTIGHKINEIEVPTIESNKIIDTSCAGDAFCGKLIRINYY
jgi:sugar/nucleoside kinase (ribokinase family)